MADNQDLLNNVPSIRCRYCGQRNQIRTDAVTHAAAVAVFRSRTRHTKNLRGSTRTSIFIRPTAARSPRCARFPGSIRR